MSAKLILTDDEVRDELSLDTDSLPSKNCQELSQFASDYIQKATNYDFGAENPIPSIAKSCAREIIYQKYFRLQDRANIVIILLADLQDIARSRTSEGES